MKLTGCFFILLFHFSFYAAKAQDKTPVKFGKLSPEDFTIPASPVIDGNTSAVIIADMGVTTFKGNNTGWVSYVFKRRTRIKILNKKGFDLATIKILLYKDGEEREMIEDLSASTYNLESDRVEVTKMEKKDIFSSEIDKNYLEQKFTLPGIKENCIIEYSYTIVSDFYFNIPAWRFQNINYPCLWSEYQVAIPDLLSYVFNRRGIHSFYIDNSNEGRANYLIRPKGVQPGVDPGIIGVSTKTIKHRWVMKDIPAFDVEDYLTTPENYRDEIDFQLSGTYSGRTKREVKNTWARVTEDLLEEKEFALFITDEIENVWLDKQLEDIVVNSKGELAMAKDIYYYLSDNFTCTDHHTKYIRTTLRDVFTSKQGNVGEINLLLTGMLLRKNIAAAPVLLSTRGYGRNYAHYPILNRLDYVICKATIGGKEYYLDASLPQLGFGYLPPECYNGHARVISTRDSASVYFVADSIREHESTYVSIVNDELRHGHLSGIYSRLMGSMASYQLRVAIAAEGEQKYFNSLNAGAGDELKIKANWIDSLKNRELPITTHQEFAIDSIGSGDVVYFNPVLWGGYKANTFTAALRKYPVEMLYPVNQTYLFNMEVPDGFVIDEVPRSARVNFNGKEGFFEYLVQKNESSVQLRSTVVLKKANFDPEEYDSLRDFFAVVVKKHAEQIVFKKK